MRSPRVGRAWIGLSLGTAVYAALLVWRFHFLTARHYLPALPAS